MRTQVLRRAEDKSDKVNIIKMAFPLEMLIAEGFFAESC